MRVATATPRESAKAWARRQLARIYQWGLRGGLFRLRPSEFLVLNFHRITTAEAFGVGLRGLVNADPRTFAHMLDFLRRYFRFVSAGEICAALEGRAPLPPDSLLLTFDDGYRDFITTALPILRSRNVPALIFPTIAGLVEPKQLLWIDKVALAVDAGVDCDWMPVPTDGTAGREPEVRKNRIVSYLLDVPGEMLMWVNEELDRRLPFRSSEVAARLYVSAQDLCGIDRAVDIGSHGVSHLALSQLSTAAVPHELTRAKAVLEAATGRVVESFAYPIGRAKDIPPDADLLLPLYGYSMGFTTELGRNNVRPGSARYRFRRVSGGHSLVELQYNLFLAWLSKR